MEIPVAYRDVGLYLSRIESKQGSHHNSDAAPDIDDHLNSDMK